MTTSPAGLTIDDRQTPAVLRVDAVHDPVAWVSQHRAALHEAVDTYRAVLVRGLGLREARTAGAVHQQLATTLMTEREAFATRWTYEPGVYSSSKWPPNQPMCMHHELSYALEFPSRMQFACLSAPASGGATAVADAARVLAELPADLVNRFERDGWLLTRSYNDEIGIGWAEAFGTSDRAEVEAYCARNEISAVWTADGGLRTGQRRPAVVADPRTGERLWFNQIAFLNEWTMAPEVREYLTDVYGRDGLPFNTSFGDGAEITEDIVQVINKTYDALTHVQPWQDGDLLLLDNLRMAHSRLPYEGAREVIVAMADEMRRPG
ncbi:TauD/TfdA family dioxygenase [Micromonospora sediminicola]|uniref:TauD/TfdA family dioxygenase n=1 Tax=Micromonospora sediminicola TaxID=946078 RepID=UPI0037AFF5AF